MNSNPPPGVELVPPEFETKPPMLLAGGSQHYECQASAGIAEQWQRFGPRLSHVPRQVGQNAYGVCYNFERDGEFDYMCGVEVSTDADLPDGFTSLAVPQQRYAIFQHRSHVAGIRATFDAIWKQWLPNSGYRSAKQPVLEVYGPQFDPQTGLGGFEIWMPIVS